MREIIITPAATGPLGFVVTHLDTSVRVICAGILWVTFLAMLLPTFANAVLRYTTNASLVWSVEVVQLIFPWFIMAGAVLAAQHGRHIGVELFVTLVPKKLTRFISVPVQFLIVASSLSVSYVYLGFGMFEGGMGYAAGDIAFTSLGVPQAWSFLAILVGYLLLGVTALVTIYRLVTGNKSRAENELISAS